MKNDLNVLYEDNHIIVVVKPPNILSQSDKTKDKDLLSQVKKYVKEKYDKPGEAFIGLVHRLDRPVGGVMVFARTSKAAQRLAVQMRERQLKKTYYAIVTHPLPQQTGELTDYLIKDHTVNISKIVREDDPNAKLAVLSYEQVVTKLGYTLLRVHLSTGRSHQIRVQLAHAHAPILGDAKYGGAPAQNICLWSYQLQLIHPVTKESMTFTSLPPNQSPWDIFAPEE